MVGEQESKIGDVVQLRSGGPLMTVASVRGDDVVCSWFEKTKHKNATFKAAQLVKPGPRRSIAIAF